MRLSSVNPPVPEEPRCRTYIVAGNHRHAVEVAHARRIPHADWTYVHDAYQLQGIGRGHTILVYETWHSMPADRHEHIRQLVKRAEQVNGAIVEHVYESDIR